MSLTSTCGGRSARAQIHRKKKWQFTVEQQQFFGSGRTQRKQSDIEIFYNYYLFLIDENVLHEKRLPIFVRIVLFSSNVCATSFCYCSPRKMISVFIIYIRSTIHSSIVEYEWYFSTTISNTTDHQLCIAQHLLRFFAHKLYTTDTQIKTNHDDHTETWLNSLRIDSNPLRKSKKKLIHFVYEHM